MSTGGYGGEICAMDPEALSAPARGELVKEHLVEQLTSVMGRSPPPTRGDRWGATTSTSA